MAKDIPGIVARLEEIQLSIADSALREQEAKEAKALADAEKTRHERDLAKLMLEYGQRQVDRQLPPMPSGRSS